MEQSVESFSDSDSITAHTLPIFQIFFFKKRDFFENPVNLGKGNLVLITSTVQAEHSKINFNFDIKTYFQVLSDCWQKTFVKLNGFVLSATPIFS